MPQRLDAREDAFPRAFASLLGLKREVAEDVDETVKEAATRPSSITPAASMASS
jgi:hypothetical protein